MSTETKEKLFMIEVMITKIVFDELPVPLKRNIIITATWATVPSMEIRTDVMGALANLETKERSAKRKDVEIDCGRSAMFPIEPSKMLEALKQPMYLVVSRRTDESIVGTVAILWNPDFTEMVESCQFSSGYHMPVYIENSFVLSNNEQYAGTIDAFIRLTFLGQHVLTNIQRTRDTQGPTAYLFKSTDNATIFKCFRHGEGSDTEVMPISAVYAITDKRNQPIGQGRPPHSKSTETLLGMQQLGSTMSVMPSAFAHMTPLDKRALINTMIADDGMSMMSVGAVKGVNYMDLTGLKADMSTMSTIETVLGMHTLYNDADSGSMEDGEEKLRPIVFEYKSLTVEEIEKQLCKHPDCPAAKLFKDYGIGPLAKNISGLGGMYKDVNAVCTYGMSHCNGTIDGYGPLGLFKRPKRPEQPFEPQKKCLCKEQSSASHHVSKSKSAKKGKVTKPRSETLRLKGGGPIENSIPCNVIEQTFPIYRDLMDQVDEILLKYKDILGPCGQASCPFAKHLVEEECKNVCNLKKPHKSLSQPDLEYKSQLSDMPACGNTNCPFLRRKLGMEIEEDIHLPPLKDYVSESPYKYTDPLPPIHWDCQDPLPKGDCKNLDCPYVKRDALIRKYFPDPRCACNDPVCPYVTVPCTFPGCPFGIAERCPPVCPYTEELPKELKCTPSICPFARTTKIECTTPECPYRQYEQKFDDCAKQQQLELRMEADEEGREEEEGPNDGKPPSEKSYKNSQKSSSVSSKLESLPTDTTHGNSESRPSGSEKKKCTPHECGIKISCKTCKKLKSEAKVEDNSQKVKDISQKMADVNEKKVDVFETKLHSGPKRKKVKQYAMKTTTLLKRESTLPKKPLLCHKRRFRFDKASFKPCNKIGHRECVLPRFIVPKNMGWLWNIHNNICGLKPRRGWKPGAISKSIALRIDYLNALREKGAWKSGTSQKGLALDSKPSKPTINVHRQGGVVQVSMLPIKDPADVKKTGDGNPHMDCSPIEFRITKNEPPGVAKKLCFCDDDNESSSTSELDIVFSPPAALINRRLISKVPMSERETQYNIDDVPLPLPPKAKEGKDKGKNKKIKKKGKK